MLGFAVGSSAGLVSVPGRAIQYLPFTTGCCNSDVFLFANSRSCASAVESEFRGLATATSGFRFDTDEHAVPCPLNDDTWTSGSQGAVVDRGLSNS